jgi:hypothetical protein
MESKYNITEIMTQVGDIGELISRMNAEGPVSAIEIDIVLEKLRKLYTDIARLKASDLSVKEKVTNAIEGKQEEAVQETVAPSKSKTQDEPATLADKFKGEKKFINERLADNGKRQDLSSKLQSKPIREISTSLGLNDRFKLINELFNGDKESYQKTINILDNAGNFNEAFSYISTSYDWDMEDEAVQLLLDLVRRKFIVNKDE